MIASRTTIGLEFGRQRIHALAGVMSRGRLQVQNSLTIQFPEPIDQYSPEELGKQLQHRFEVERLAVESAAVVFSSVSEVDKSSQELSRADERIRRIVASAGLSLTHLQTRSQAVKALAPTLQHEVETSILVIDIGDESIEFTSVKEQDIVFSRVVTVPPPNDRLTIVEAVVSEVQAYRVQGSYDADAVCLIGDDRTGEYLKEAIGSLLECPVRVFRSHPRISFLHGISASHWLLASVILELADFEKPNEEKVESSLQPSTLGMLTMFAIAACLVAVLSSAIWTLLQDDDFVSSRTMNDVPSNVQRSESIPLIEENAVEAKVDFGDYKDWSLTGVAQTSAGAEAWLLNQLTNESRRLTVGEKLDDATLIAARGEDAEFLLGSERLIVTVGRSLDERAVD